MKLTNEQSELAIQLRALLAGARISDDALANLGEEQLRPAGPEAWSHFIDFTRANAVLLNCLKDLPMPSDAHKVFDAAWQAYTSYWAAEHQRVILETLGPVMAERVQQHPNGVNVVNRIIKRAREQVGIKPGSDFSKLNVGDILVEEGIC